MTMSSCAGTHAMAMRQPLSFDGVHGFLDTLFGDDLHAKRVKSLAGATLGAIQSASLAVGLIGQGLALARGRLTKHAVKQVDRLLSNRGIDVDALLVHWVPYVVGQRDSITVAMDWTEFDADGQATIMLSLLSRHGRATPLVWLTVDKATLKNRRNGYEYQVLVRLAEILPAEVRVRIVADRGFGDHKLYRVLSEELKFDFVIRFRGNIAVTATDGEARAAADWVGAGGRARTLRGAAVTAQAYPVATVVCVRAKGMKEPWCLAASTCRRTRAGLDQAVCQALGDRGRFPRHKGSPLRHGARIDACQHAGPARPPVADQCLRSGLADASGRRRRTTGLRSAPQDQHLQTAHSFAVPSGQHALRTHAEHDRFPPAATHQAVRPDARSPTPLRTNVRCHLRMRGIMSIHITVFARYRSLRRYSPKVISY